MKLKNSNPELNSLIGDCIRYYRIQKRLSQKNVATQLHISYQQIQKYESGENRISLERLYFLSLILDFTLEEFCKKLEKKLLQSEELDKYFWIKY